MTRRAPATRSSPLGRHGPASLGDLIDGFVGKLLFLDSEQPSEKVPSLARNTVPGSEPHQEVPDLRLEDHDQRQHTYIYKGVQQGVHESHVQSCHHDPQHEKEDDGEERTAVLKS